MSSDAQTNSDLIVILLAIILLVLAPWIAIALATVFVLVFWPRQVLKLLAFVVALAVVFLLAALYAQP